MEEIKNFWDISQYIVGYAPGHLALPLVLLAGGVLLLIYLFKQETISDGVKAGAAIGVTIVFLVTGGFGFDQAFEELQAVCAETSPADFQRRAELGCDKVPYQPPPYQPLPSFGPPSLRTPSYYPYTP